MQIHIQPPTTEEAYQDIRHLLKQYARMRNYDPALDNFAHELQALDKLYAAPEGAILLARRAKTPVGCVALRALSGTKCEMKRLFVVPEMQGQGIGRLLAEQIMEEGVALGYTSMYLDTHPWMTSAHGLYQSLGFKETTRYNQNPTPGIRFFVTFFHA